MSGIRRWKIGPHAPFADGDTPELKHQFVVLLSDHEARLAARDAEIAKLKAALADCRAGLVYIRETHGDLYGIGWDRAIKNADALLFVSEKEGCPK